MFVFDLCRQLAAHGVQVTVLAPHARGAKQREILENIEVRRFRYAPEAWERLAYEGGIMANLKRSPLLYGLLPLFFLAQFATLVRCLRASRYDAVHAHWFVPQGLSLAAASRLGVGRPRLVCTAHGSDVSALRGVLWSTVRRWIASRCDHVVTVSTALRDRLVTEGCETEKLSVIPMGVNLDGKFIPNETERAAAEILFVGRLVPGKGLDILIGALPQIRAINPVARLSIVGDGLERPRLEDITRSLGLASCVDFFGAVENSDLPRFYRRATLLVLPSLEEGFGLVVAEALGCGCPVAASDLPAVRDLLEDGRGGRLFRTGDSADLTEKVCELLANERLRQSLAETGRATVLERYDWNTIGQRYLSVLLP
jgi:glycosyltransferase involved in cell wall biosynthesis